MSRIEPLAAPYPPEITEQLQRMMPGPPIALFRVFVKNLPMATAMTSWGRYELGREFSLSLREREILIDRTCALAGCEYEWGVHVAFFAERAGFEPDQLRSLTGGNSDDPCWSAERERVLIRTADLLFVTGDLDDDGWSELRTHCSEAEALDVLLLCGWYRAISLVGRALRLPSEPGTPTFAQIAAPSARSWPSA